MLALRAAPRTIQAQVRKFTKAIAAPEWKQALAQRADTRLAQRVLVDTAVVTVSNQNVKVQSASKGRPLSGGLNPRVDYPAVEFGGNKKVTTFTRRSPKGRAHTVTRDTHAQLPRFKPKGHVFWPAAVEMVPRMFKLWAQTTVKTIGNMLDGKQE